MVKDAPTEAHGLANRDTVERKEKQNNTRDLKQEWRHRINNYPGNLRRRFLRGLPALGLAYLTTGKRRSPVDSGE